MSREHLPLPERPVANATVEFIDGLKYLLNPEDLSDQELDRAEVLLEDLMTDAAQLGEAVRAEKARRHEATNPPEGR